MSAIQSPPARSTQSAQSLAPLVVQQQQAGKPALIVGWLCLLAMAGVFLYAGIEKIIEPRQFVIAIKNYRIIPETWLHAQALYLPWVEVLAAIALLIPATRKAGGLLIVFMLLIFITAVSYSALYKGYNIDCGCFGKGSSQAGYKTIGLDLVFLIATLLGIRLTSSAHAVIQPNP